MALHTPILSLTTARPRIEIDGTVYDLRQPTELPYRSGGKSKQRLQRLAVLEALSGKQGLKKAQRQEFSVLLEQLCQDVLIAPPAVLASLRDDHRYAIVLASFVPAPSRKPAATAAARTPAKRGTSTSTRSPRG